MASESSKRWFPCEICHVRAGVEMVDVYFLCAECKAGYLKQLEQERLAKPSAALPPSALSAVLKSMRSK